MKGLRLLHNGAWSKPPVLTAARRILIASLGTDFRRQPLGEVASFLNGTSYDKSRLSERGRAPIIRISNITDPTSTYLRTAEDLDRRFWVRKGDLLVSWSASFKSTLWRGPEGFLNQHIFKVTERPNFSRSYIRHAIEASFDAMQENVVGIGMMHLRRSAFLLHEIPAPPLSIQDSVATFLNWVEEGFQGPEPQLPKSLAKQRRIIAQIEELAGEIHEARALRAQAQEEVQALRARAATDILNRASQTFPIRRLEELVEVRGGGTPSKSDPFYWDGVIPWITPKDMKVREIRDAIDHISERATRESAARLLAPGAVLVVVRGMILAHTVPSAVLRVPGAINQDMKALFPNKDLLPEFLSCAFWGNNARLLELVEKSTHDTRKLETAKLLSSKIPVPPLHEQRRIIDELDGLESQTERLKRLQADTAAELDALLPIILDRVLSGEL